GAQPSARPSTQSMATRWPLSSRRLSGTARSIPSSFQWYVTLLVPLSFPPRRSSDLPMVRPDVPGQVTVIVAEAVLFAKVVEASLVGATVTVFGRVPQSVRVVARDRVIVRDAPLVRVPKAQLRTPLAIEQSPAFGPPRVQVPRSEERRVGTARRAPGRRLLAAIEKGAGAPPRNVHRL